MPLIPAYYYRSVCLCRKGNYQNALKVFLQRGKPTRGIRPKQHLSGCLACFLAAIPARLWTQMEIHLLPVPSWLVFLFYSHLLAPPPPPSQEPVCQQKPCTSPCAYQTVYPFPVGAVLHLWLWQPIATPKVHSKPWFRHPALPALLYQPLSPLSCEFFTREALGPNIMPFPNVHVRLTHARKQTQLWVLSLPYICSHLYTHR